MRALAVAVVLLSAPVFAGDAGVITLGPPVPSEVKRVVTLAPSLTQTLIALGVADRVVGVSRFDDAAEVAKVTRVGGFNDPSVESIIALKPQLLLVQKAPANQKPVEAMAKLGVPVVAVPLTSVSDVLDSLRLVGRLMGVAEKGEALAADIEATRAKVRAEAPKKKPSVLFIYGFKPLVVAGPGSFADELLSDAGGQNVAQKAPTAYPVFSLERAVALAPELIIDASDVSDGRDELKALLKKSRWAQVKSKALLQPGPTLGEGLRELQTLLK